MVLGLEPQPFFISHYNGHKLLSPIGQWTNVWAQGDCLPGIAWVYFGNKQEKLEKQVFGCLTWELTGHLLFESRLMRGAGQGYTVRGSWTWVRQSAR